MSSRHNRKYLSHSFRLVSKHYASEGFEKFNENDSMIALKRTLQKAASRGGVPMHPSLIVGEIECPENPAKKTVEHGSSVKFKNRLALTIDMYVCNFILHLYISRESLAFRAGSSKKKKNWNAITEKY